MTSERVRGLSYFALAALQCVHRGSGVVSPRRGSGSVQNPMGSFWLACLFLWGDVKESINPVFSGRVGVSQCAGFVRLFGET